MADRHGAPRFAAFKKACSHEPSQRPICRNALQERHLRVRPRQRRGAAPGFQEDCQRDRPHARRTKEDVTVALAMPKPTSAHFSPTCLTFPCSPRCLRALTEAGVPLLTGINEDEGDALVLIVPFLDTIKGWSTSSSFALSSPTGPHVRPCFSGRTTSSLPAAPTRRMFSAGFTRITSSAAQKSRQT